MSSEHSLTRAEQRILEEPGALIDLREARRDDNEPVRTPDRSPECEVRAGFLRELVTGPGATSDAPEIRKVRLRGGWITGALDFEGENLNASVFLQDCVFDEPVNLREAQAVAISLPGCHLPSLEAWQLQVQGNLFLGDGLTAALVDLRSAQVNGVLSLDGAVLDNPGGTALHGGGLTVGQGMRCGNGFSASGEVNLIGAKISGGLYFTGATLRNTSGWALDVQGMSVTYALFLGSSYNDSGGFTADGSLRLVGMRVDGFMCCWDAHIKASDGIRFAIAGLGLTVRENLMLSNGFTADGEVHLTNAQIGDEISFSGAILTNPGGRALNAERLVVGDSILCTDGFTARGSINLADSKIGGSLDFTGAFLNEPSENAVDLRGVRAKTLVARPAAQAKQMDLRHASVIVLDDDPATWPAHLLLRDFNYQIMEHDPAVTASERLIWIERDLEGFIPQPYEQLISAYRHAGHEEAARTVAIAKQRRKCRTLHPVGKIWNWLLYVTIGYGYRTWQAGLWLLALLLIGTVVFAHAYPVT